MKFLKTKDHLGRVIWMNLRLLALVTRLEEGKLKLMFIDRQEVTIDNKEIVAMLEKVMDG